jgi:DNA-binding LytR/AlgR family response regulator
MLLQIASLKNFKSHFLVKKIILTIIERQNSFRAILPLFALFLVALIIFNVATKNAHTEQGLLVDVVEYNGSVEQFDPIEIQQLSDLKTENYINLGNRNSLWLKLKLVNNEETKAQADNLILVLNKNRINTPVEFYYLNNSHNWIKQVIWGNPEFHYNIISQLPNNIASNTFYIRLQGRYLRTSVEVLTNAELLKSIQQKALMSGLFYGMLGLFALYHLMLFLRLKEPAYLAYSVMLFVLGLWFLSGQAWLEYLFPHVNYLHNKTVFLGSLLVVAIAEFAKHYLGIKTLNLRLFNALQTAQLLLIILAVLRLSTTNTFPEQVNTIGYTVGILTSFVIFICCFTAAILAVKKQVVAAGYYLSATIIFFVMASIMALSAGNIINFHFSWPLLQISSALEVVIFSAGLVSIYYQQQQKEQAVARQLKQTQLNLVKQLEFTNALKDKILNDVIDHKLFPALAQVTNILSDILYVQALGNDCLVVYKKENRTKKIELSCNLQNLLDCFGGEYFLRIHKSYLINPAQVMSLQRRTSADYDLKIGNEVIPIGRKYISDIKNLI